jgi:hypothetical protein
MANDLSRRSDFMTFLLSMSLIGLLGSVSCASAEETDIWKVEEDWELRTYQPDPSIYSPQVTFFVTPDSTKSDTYFQLQMNYAADNVFSAGGFHVAAVKSDSMVDEERSDQQITLSLPSDSLTWTNVMAVVDGKLLFAVKDGLCQEWGQFGGPEYLVQIDGSATSHLAQYNYVDSIENVDIGFGKNRVQSIKLKHVRLFRADGSVSTIDLTESE